MTVQIDGHAPYASDDIRPIPGFDDYYATADGRIISRKRKRAIEMKQMVTRYGYAYVYLSENGNQTKMLVHRAVLSAFSGINPPDLECRHLNDISLDNRLVNLRWGTRLENADDRKRNGGYPVGEESTSSKLTSDQVMQIRKRYASGEYAYDLGREYGIASGSVLGIIRGKSWSHLPVIPVTSKHSPRRRKPITDEERKKLSEYARRRTITHKIPRTTIECACGCGQLLETPDSKGRRRIFVHGHNAKGKHWRWKNGTDNKD